MGKEIVLTIDTECIRRDGKCYNLPIGESGYDTTTIGGPTIGGYHRRLAPSMNFLCVRA